MPIWNVLSGWRCPKNRESKFPLNFPLKGQSKIDPVGGINVYQKKAAAISFNCGSIVANNLRLRTLKLYKASFDIIKT